jgi:hypothetical protein
VNGGGHEANHQSGSGRCHASVTRGCATRPGVGGYSRRVGGTAAGSERDAKRVEEDRASIDVEHITKRYDDKVTCCDLVQLHVFDDEKRP